MRSWANCRVNRNWLPHEDPLALTRLALDNNPAQRALRGVALGRKNVPAPMRVARVRGNRRYHYKLAERFIPGRKPQERGASLSPGALAGPQAHNLKVIGSNPIPATTFEALGNTRVTNPPKSSVKPSPPGAQAAIQECAYALLWSANIVASLIPAGPLMNGHRCPADARPEKTSNAHPRTWYPAAK